MPAIHLDDPLQLRAVEVGDIRTDRVLTAKLQSPQPTVAEDGPEHRLGLALVAAEGTGSGEQFPRDESLRSHVSGTHTPPSTTHTQCEKAEITP